MTFTLEKLQDSIMGVLKEHYPGVKTYGNPNQQGTKTPCFFVFFMPSDIEGEMDRRTRRIIGVDIVYLTKRNIPDSHSQMYAVADRLDEILDRIPYTDKDETAELWTFEREWKVDEGEGELHYQFTVKPIVSQPDDTPAIETMDYEGGLKRENKQSE